MIKTEFNKLVRDKIPEIIAKNGERAVTRILGDEEYLRYLELKLDEEVKEFHESGEAEELADILEVILALCAAKGISETELWSIYRKKHDERGGFADRILLISNE